MRKKEKYLPFETTKDRNRGKDGRSVWFLN